ncbi:MAG TPA: Crp/Fnr family transcriptional regulator [Cyclobacteriaceae bacterium]|jgi:CRP-like cAMP-binding protein|nr:Crp/Fnr family transcriptional regulator [Cyclobacteriaceae bacterium]
MNPRLLISNISRHVALNTEETTFFVSLLKPLTLKAGGFLVREGDICKYESFVTRGCLKAYYEDDNGIEHVQDFLVEEWWADDLYSFLTQTPSKSSVKAIEDTDLLQISKEDLEMLYQKVPKFERFFRLLFQKAYISQRDQINQMLSVPAEERYVQFLKRKPYALKRFTQKDIASYLGVTPQFFSTLKKKIDQVNVD